MTKFFRISNSAFPGVKLTAALFRKEGRPILVHLFRQLYLIGGRPNQNWMKVIKVYLMNVNRLKRHQGLPGTVKYLKASSVLLQQVIAGHVLPDTGELGPRVRRSCSGYPSLIPVSHRKNIADGDQVVIKF